MRSLASAAVLTLSVCYPANAGQFDGWCFPANACTGSPSRIENDSFGTCENNCIMDNPVSVRGLRATLYDVTCSGDSGTYESRMLFAVYEDGDGGVRAVTLDDSGITDLERCDADGTI